MNLRCERCGQAVAPGARFCRSCGAPVVPLVMPLGASARPQRNLLLAVPLAIVIVGIAAFGWAIYQQNSGGTGGGGAASAATAVMPASPPRPAPPPYPMPLRPVSFPGYGLEILVPSEWRGLSASEFASRFPGLEDANVVLLAAYSNAGANGGAFVLANRTKSPGLDVKSLEVTGKVIVRDMSDPSSPAVPLQIGRIAGRLTLVSDPITRAGGWGRVLIMAGPRRAFYFLCFGQSRAVCEEVYSRFRSALERTRFTGSAAFNG